MGQIRANIGDSMYSKINEKAKYNYIIHCVKFTQIPGKRQQERNWLVYLDNKRTYDRFKRFKQVVCDESTLIHDPELQRKIDIEEALEREKMKKAAAEAKEKAEHELERKEAAKDRAAKARAARKTKKG